MNFDYCRETSLPGCGAPSSYPYTYHFQFSLSYDEIRKVYHKYGYEDIDSFISLFGTNIDEFYKILASIELIRDAISSDKVDLGIDYKKKYDELVELLEPYKIDESMEPSTTLKILLKYNK
jgi:hypothetical protein